MSPFLKSSSPSTAVFVLQEENLIWTAISDKKSPYWGRENVNDWPKLLT